MRLPLTVTKSIFGIMIKWLFFVFFWTWEKTSDGDLGFPVQALWLGERFKTRCPGNAADMWSSLHKMHFSIMRLAADACNWRRTVIFRQRSHSSDVSLLTTGQVLYWKTSLVSLWLGRALLTLPDYTLGLCNPTFFPKNSVMSHISQMFAINKYWWWEPTRLLIAFA